MSCPFFTNRTRESDILRMRQNGNDVDEQSNTAQKGSNEMANEGGVTYAGYLQLSKVLSAQFLLSAEGGSVPQVHDEHLFIITHQAFELWFKQILFDIDSVRDVFTEEYLEERNQLTIISRLGRVTDVFKLLCSQFVILETMTPQDFLEMRQYLGNSSGFQSFQFRMIEIRLGVREELRVLYNRTNYESVFFGEERQKIERAKAEKSLFSHVNNWLERTPGLEVDGFNFCSKFKSSVSGMLAQNKEETESCSDPVKREILLQEYEEQCETFKSFFDEDIHNDLVAKGSRRLSHKAMQGAMMIYLYREEPRYHLPFQILHCLVDIDGQFTKLRYGHTCMVQRMIGGKIGTGGSSGYLYLRSTCSDRYKVFIDLMNLSSFLVTRDRIPPLTEKIKRSLSIHSWLDETVKTQERRSSDTDVDSGVVTSICSNLRRLSKSSTSSCSKIPEAQEASGTTV